MTTTAPINLPTDPRPIATVNTTTPSVVREMTMLLTRRYGPGLMVQKQPGRTVWLVPANRKRGAL